MPSPDVPLFPAAPGSPPGLEHRLLVSHGNLSSPESQASCPAPQLPAPGPASQRAPNSHLTYLRPVSSAQPLLGLIHFSLSLRPAR